MRPGSNIRNEYERFAKKDMERIEEEVSMVDTVPRTNRMSLEVAACHSV